MTRAILKLDNITIEGGTQSRAEINEATVAEYSELYRLKVELPPPQIIYDGVTHFLWDGFHRFHGAGRAGLKELECEQKRGSLRDAILLSLGANHDHGLKRTHADKRKCVLTLLADSEWAKMSNVAVAEACHVGKDLVLELRKSPLKVQVAETHRDILSADSSEKPYAKIPSPSHAEGFSVSDGIPTQEQFHAAGRKIMAAIEEQVGKPSKKKVTGKDGKEYPAKKSKPESKEQTTEDKMKAANSALEALARKITEIGTEAQALQNPHLMIQRYGILVAQLASASATIRAAKGKAVCTECKADSQKVKVCRRCHATGWMDASTHNTYK